MGNLPFTAVGADGAKRQGIQVFAESLLTTFTTEYTTAYAQEYTKHLLQDKDDDNSNVPVVGSCQLMQRDIHSLQKPKKTGMMTKRGAIVKNWKHRFFVVKSDYTVDYYENMESLIKNAKPKGTISPCGYEVVKDMENAMLKRTRRLAEKMGVDVNDIPVPDKFPDFTFELYHKRRRPWIMTANSAEDLEDWCSVFEDCCYHCNGYKNEDPIARKAFPIAMRRTRFETGSMASTGVSASRGSEEQELSDFIVAEVDAKMMGDIYSNIKGNWTIRNKIREQIVKTLDSAVMAMVTPALKNLDLTVHMLRQSIDVLVAQKKDELAAVERKIMWEMNEQIKAPVDDALAKMRPDVERLAEMAIPPLESGFDKCRELFIKAVKELQESLNKMPEVHLEANADEVFEDIDRTYNRSSRYPNRCVGEMKERHESLPQLQVMEVHVDNFIRYGREFCKTLLDSEVYTFQELFMESAKEVDNVNKGEVAARHAETVQEKVLQRFDCDRLVALHHCLYKSLVDATNRALRKELDPDCKPLIKPIQEVIPTALDQVVRVRDMYEKYVLEACEKFVLKVLKDQDQEPPKIERGASVKEKEKVEANKPVQYDDPPRVESEMNSVQEKDKMANADEKKQDTSNENIDNQELPNGDPRQVDESAEVKESDQKEAADETKM